MTHLARVRPRASLPPSPRLPSNTLTFPAESPPPNCPLSSPMVSSPSMMMSADGAAHSAGPDDVRADKLAYYLLKAVNKANRRYRLLADGDVVLVAVSGGKDSLTLLHLLDRRRQTARESYTLVAGLIRSDTHCGRAVPGAWLRAWCRGRGISLVVEEVQIAQELAETTLSRCFRCAWNRRKALFEMARRLGCNKLAFGHHADDVAQTTLMNLFYSGRFEGMAPKGRFFGGELVVVRPLVLVEERDIVPFARASGYPLEGEPCPDGASSHRALVKRVLRELEQDNHKVKRSIYRALDQHRRALAMARCVAPE